jgi:hypothetical protein
MTLRQQSSRPLRGPASTVFPFRATGTIRSVTDGRGHTGAR